MHDNYHLSLSPIAVFVALSLLSIFQKLWGEVFMKKIWVGVAGALFLLAVIALAADQPASHSATITTNNEKPAKMNARGKVIEISDATIKIERTIKGNIEIFEFSLEYPLVDIAVNDEVKIDYRVKDDKLTASKVLKIAVLKNPAHNGEKTRSEKPASAAK